MTFNFTYSPCIECGGITLPEDPEKEKVLSEFSTQVGPVCLKCRRKIADEAVMNSITGGLDGFNLLRYVDGKFTISMKEMVEWTSMGGEDEK